MHQLQNFISQKLIKLLEQILALYLYRSKNTVKLSRGLRIKTVHLLFFSAVCYNGKNL
jgi:hypothetical protein